MIAVALAAMVSSARAGEVSGAAIVVDGDTLAIAGQRFDLLGIDAPELPQLCEADGKRWACGEDATMVLRRIIAGREVTCAAHGEGERGAVLAVCRIGFEGLNREMVRAGMALNPPRGPALYVREEAARPRPIRAGSGRAASSRPGRGGPARASIRRRAVGDGAVAAPGGLTSTRRSNAMAPA